MNPEQAAELGRLDPQAIQRVIAEAWPEVRNADELHDALCVLGFLTTAEGAVWATHFEVLRADRRAAEFSLAGGEVLWVSAERLAEVQAALPTGRMASGSVAIGGFAGDVDGALHELVRSRLEASGPMTAAALAEPLDLTGEHVAIALAALEQQGIAMRGRFSDAGVEEWCERRLLARIHRYTLKRLRNEIEPVSLADYQRFLFDWQGLGDARREGKEALRAVLTELQGLSLAASVWEREVLPARIVDYRPSLIDELCASGEIVWWRPRPSTAPEGSRVTTVAASPIAIVARETLEHWRQLGVTGVPPNVAIESVSANAQRVVTALRERGALFFIELVQQTGLLRVQVEDALGELVARGLVTADAFNGLRALLTPQRHRQRFGSRGRARAPAGFDAAGRWTLLTPIAEPTSAADRRLAVEHVARTLLRRYGVVARSVLSREAMLPTWRELIEVWRRWEARGEIRGGRFVGALGGEQFALTEAVEALRRTRRNRDRPQWVTISAADPLNLHSITESSKRIPAVNTQRVVFRDGVAVAVRGTGGVECIVPMSPADRQRVIGG
jgi:ATP-dependent Lhr-like helicase